MADTHLERDFLGALPNETKYRIATFLDNSSLFALSCVSRSLVGAANCVLYKRDARAGERKSRAIVTAVTDGLFATTRCDEDAAATRWKRSLLYGADVNSQCGKDDVWYDTPLMVATFAATNTQITWIKRLLDQGALTSVESKTSPPKLQEVDLGSLQSRFWTPETRHSNSLLCLKEEVIDSLFYCLPLFYPMVQKNKEVCRLLLNEGSADLRLAWTSVDHPGTAVLSAIHVIALSGDDEMGFLEKMVARFPHLIDDELPTTRTRGVTALHLAILSLNTTAFSILLEGRANVQAEMGPLRKTPLHLVIGQMTHDEEDADLKTMVGFVEELLARGANANFPLAVGTTFTPLMKLLDVMKMQTRGSNVWLKTIKTTAERLLQYGADTNYTTQGGMTPLTLLVDICMSQVCPSEVQTVAKTFISTWINDHEADPNMGVWGQPSLLGRVYERHAGRGTDQMDTFVKLKANGATFNALEANEFFPEWKPGSDLRDNYNMVYHASHIRQDLLDKAYRRAFDQGTPKKILKEIKYLHIRFSPPSDAAKLISLALKEHFYSSPLLAKVLEFDFDGTRLSKKHPGRGLINQVVELLISDDNGYREYMAHRDCMTLIDHGASVQHRNENGLKPIQVLRRAENPISANKYASLKSLLREKQDVENGEW